jgi:hypothetical protein
MALGSNQSLTEMSTTDISNGVKAAGACAGCLEICEPQPPRTFMACASLYSVALSL